MSSNEDIINYKLDVESWAFTADEIEGKFEIDED